MKVVILAGGLGTRLSELTTSYPKPMVHIGNRPILFHIMSIYSHFGFNEFIIALGYKSEVIKDYFLNFYYLNNDLTVKLSTGQTTIHNNIVSDWTVNLIDTGLHVQTGGRLKRLKKWIGNERFLMTYGDGVADINIHELVKFHESQGKKATVTAVRPPARFGNILFNDNLVSDFSEKAQTSEGWINGGFFVLEPEVLDYIEDDMTPWEKRPLERLSSEGELAAYKHEGFWQPMDTLREQQKLESMWQTGQAPWINNLSKLSKKTLEKFYL
jgi:glucose-1-phosphate cytidylyltransferase